MPRRKRRISGSIDRRGNGYRVRVQVDGVSRTVTIRTSDRRVADAHAEQLTRELEREAERRAAGLVTGRRISELFDSFVREVVPTKAPGTQSAYGDTLKALRQYFVKELADPSLASLRAAQVHGYLTWRHSHRIGGTAAVSARTLAKDRAVLHRIFAYGVRELEWCEVNPVAAVRPPRADARTPVILDSTQYAALLTECGDRPMLRLYVLILGETGARCDSEALWLRWEDVDLERRSMVVVTGRNGHRTKSGRSRAVPMTDALVRAMRAHFARFRFAQYSGKPTPWVLHHDRTALRFHAGNRIGSLYDGFRNAAARAKLPREFRQHDLRHRRVTTWLEQGHPATKVKMAMGHANIATTMGYEHLVAESLRSLVEPMPVPVAKEAGGKEATA